MKILQLLILYYYKINLKIDPQHKNTWNPRFTITIFYLQHKHNFPSLFALITNTTIVGFPPLQNLIQNIKNLLSHINSIYTCTAKLNMFDAHIDDSSRGKITLVLHFHIVNNTLTIRGNISLMLVCIKFSFIWLLFEEMFQWFKIKSYKIKLIKILFVTIIIFKSKVWFNYYEILNLYYVIWIKKLGTSHFFRKKWKVLGRTYTLKKYIVVPIFYILNLFIHFE